ncbi:lyase [Motiliproteus sp. SC1-56]|uniref:Vgb family protein n=1 Tax=Motiliproteus sp. SC1-56 TaxID=2799565 RepID=UPI001A8D3058|nr:lyase [Motiliproteus sp. SC1-56]
MGRRLTPLLLFASLVCANLAAAPALSEWPLPWPDSLPRDPVIAADGRVWFCAQRGDFLGVFDPASERFSRFPLPPGSGPHDLAIDSDGQIWYAGNGNAHLGRLDPASGAITPYPLPLTTMDPHTLALDGQGSLWFTLPGSNLVGRLQLTSGNLRFVAPLTEAARPSGLLIDRRGHPRVALFTTNRIATLGPRSMQLIEGALPAPGARPHRLTLGADGAIWYSDSARGILGRYQPTQGWVHEWPLPGGPGSKPHGLARDARGRIWVAETGFEPNRLVAFDPQEGRFGAALAVASGAGGIRRMRFDPARNEIWFGTDRNTLVRLRPGP